MPHQQDTIDPARANFFHELKEAVGTDALQTIDPKSFKASQLKNQQPRVSASDTGPAKYSCSTQKPMPVNFGGSTNVAALQVGFGKIIPRWKTGPNKTVNFAAFESGYPDPSFALVAANALKEAADEWNGLELGVQFKWVAKIEDAAFVLSFANSENDGVLAQAFFPNEVDLNVLNVYKAAFQPGTVQYLKNIFLHELGHVLGFRHEFAPELEDTTNNYTVQIGPRDPLSVMGYEFPPQIQHSDIESAKAFYQFPGTGLGFKEGRARNPPKNVLQIKDYNANN
ncbi:hypothetical protein EYZ11_011777 [Aspergillus tanneri]|uniref:Peptidase metallopeptidase domain-containing protein n=1 Tax=Aspergillus tanneri TaxID=1220188 RepID=A0A4S3J432_9EURO|nr:uncharacterized protein ATNIH1004_008458 [Aspergillus tanneri]KAA8644259.1 hypothetical protein ATNIH1004_008458 [Aspergillus tanneri]THC88778.1 hypothetical protein EYZ11_011777 [Aspergillus tanneri]